MQFFRIIAANISGYVSWRNAVVGSWFIQSICEVFSQHAHAEHVMDMLTMVNRKVSSVTSSTGHKQVPEPCSRLLKKFFFYPGLYLTSTAAAASNTSVTSISAGDSQAQSRVPHHLAIDEEENTDA